MPKVEQTHRLGKAIDNGEKRTLFIILAILLRDWHVLIHDDCKKSLSNTEIRKILLDQLCYYTSGGRPRVDTLRGGVASTIASKCLHSLRANLSLRGKQIKK